MKYDGINTMVHLGGQVGFNTVYTEALCWLKATWNENENNGIKINEWKRRVEERCRAAFVNYGIYRLLEPSFLIAVISCCVVQRMFG